MLISSLLSLIHATKPFPMIDHPDSRHPLRDERLRILTEKCRHNLQNLHCIKIPQIETKILTRMPDQRSRGWVTSKSIIVGTVSMIRLQGFMGAHMIR